MHHVGTSYSVAQSGGVTDLIMDQPRVENLAEFIEGCGVSVCIKETGHDGNENGFLSKLIPFFSNKVNTGREYRMRLCRVLKAFFFNDGQEEDRYYSEC